MIRFAVRLLVVTVAVLVAAHLASREGVALLMPALSAALGFAAEDFKILRFEFLEERGNASIGALAVLAHTVVLGGRAIVPDGTQVIVATTTVGTVLQPVLAGLVLLLAWPGRWGETALRLVLGVPLLLGIVLIDTPSSLAAWLWQVLLRAHAPQESSALLAWNTFLNGGGRPALGLIAASLSIVGTQALLARGHRAGDPAAVSKDALAG